MPDPHEVLHGYWSWGQYVQPAPRHLAALLTAVRCWLADSSEQSRATVRQALGKKRSAIDSEIRQNPEFTDLFEACCALSVPTGSRLSLVRADPMLDGLVHQYERLPKAVAWKVWRSAPSKLELDELTGIANAALVAAAARWYSYCLEHNYDPGHVQYFQQFATMRIKGAIYDSLRSSDWVTRKIRSNARTLLEAGQGSGVSPEQLAERTGLSLVTVNETLAAMYQAPVSLEIQEFDISDPVQTIESQVVAKQILDVFALAVTELSKEEQYVIALKYYCNLSLDDISVELNMTKSRISSLHQDAVLALHAAMYAYAQDPESDNERVPSSMD